MSEEKGVRELERELKQARIVQKNEHDARIEKNKSRDYSLGVGIDKDSTVEKKTPNASDDLEEIAEEHELSEEEWSSVDDASDYLFEHKVLEEE